MLLQWHAVKAGHHRPWRKDQESVFPARLPSTTRMAKQNGIKCLKGMSLFDATIVSKGLTGQACADRKRRR